MISPEATLITLRESLEAFLILGILAGLVVKLGRPEARKPLFAGAGAALAVSIVAGVVIDRTTRGLSDRFEETFEGIAALLAVAILTYMVVWMYQHTISLVSSLREKAKVAIDAGKPWALFSLAFVAVVREGLETVLFFGTLTADVPVMGLVLSAAIGLGTAAVAAWLIFSGVVRLSLRRFFAVTGILLILFAGGLMMTSVHEFAEVGILPETTHLWDTSAFLDQESPVGAFAKAVLGYRDSPTLLEAGAYVAYVAGLGAWYLRGVVATSRMGVGSPEQT